MAAGRRHLFRSRCQNKQHLSLPFSKFQRDESHTHCTHTHTRHAHTVVVQGKRNVRSSMFWFDLLAGQSHGRPMWHQKVSTRCRCLERFSSPSILSFLLTRKEKGREHPGAKVGTTRSCWTRRWSLFSYLKPTTVAKTIRLTLNKRGCFVLKTAKAGDLEWPRVHLTRKNKKFSSHNMHTVTAGNAHTGNWLEQFGAQPFSFPWVGDSSAISRPTRERHEQKKNSARHHQLFFSLSLSLQMAPPTAKLMVAQPSSSSRKPLSRNHFATASDRNHQLRAQSTLATVHLAPVCGNMYFEIETMSRTLQRSPPLGLQKSISENTPCLLFRTMTQFLFKHIWTTAYGITAFV